MSDSRGRLFEFRIDLALSLRKMCLIAFLADRKALHLFFRKKDFILKEIAK
ncbi:hypothetical protein AID31_000130 [Salmonella enterica subsp. enterica]|nr:hypothetical protein [Salmonella enterica subsp. enterica]EDW2095070.1 hypothetical protein [Salmonella enterica subsp. enterica]EEC0903349.1 hypothetical protein [Salmonella enterica subsp. enterica]EEJ8536957.1 hypothetical protein [Salmonella enterica subsp. enterica]